MQFHESAKGLVFIFITDAVSSTFEYPKVHHTFQYQDKNTQK